MRYLLPLAMLTASTLMGQGRSHLLIVSGLSGDAMHATRFLNAAQALHQVATTAWRAEPASIIWLAENANADNGITSRVSRASIDSAFTRLAALSSSGDRIMIFLMGHGSGEGGASRIAVPGPDPTTADYATWLARLKGRTVVLVIAASGSGDFLPILSGPERVIITATRSSSERNESVFGEHFAAGLATGAADADRNSAITALEAYLHTRQSVIDSYEADGRLLTEHSQLDDNGDGVGTGEPTAAGPDGLLASRTAFGGRALPSDPALASLHAERTALEARIDALRQRSASMPQDQFLAALEPMLLDLARLNERIRSQESGGSR